MKKFLRFDVDQCNGSDLADNIILTNEFQSGTKVTMNQMSFTTEKSNFVLKGCAIVNRKKLDRIRKSGAVSEIKSVYEYVESDEEEEE